ncbi:MAG: thiamine pyrophosphate-binding protein, partial [Paracoccaceae bacterium]|nr:thiamine pyrophosphate-binding protein [Paracoccaceae bacterium]
MHYLPEMFREAFRVAHAPRKGPVQVNLPRDVLSTQADYEPFQPVKDYRPCSAPAGEAGTIERTAQRLSEAIRPVIIAGGGIKNTEGHTAALALAEALKSPIVTWPGHGDAIPFGHPLNAGQMGPRGNPVASKLIKEADVILALGS